ARRAWATFSVQADISRPKGNSRTQYWSYRDALAKAKALCKKPHAGIRWRNGRHPASHLNCHRRPGYWAGERKEQHHAEAARRTVTRSYLIVNKAMLDAMSVDAGKCVATVGDLARQTGLAWSTVKVARRQLIDLGLWIAERGVYVPVPMLEHGIGQADDP